MLESSLGLWPLWRDLQLSSTLGVHGKTLNGTNMGTRKKAGKALPRDGHFKNIYWLKKKERDVYF